MGVVRWGVVPVVDIRGKYGSGHRRSISRESVENQ